MSTTKGVESPGHGLQSRVRRGFVWSALSNTSLRMASLVSGVILARILAPTDFGVFAIGLMVQSILINLAELGLAADLVRHGDLRRRGPTITTIALVTSGLLTVLAWVTAEPVAAAMGSADAAPVIQLMSLTLPMAALTAVPYAKLQREFQQGRLFAIDTTNFAVGTSLTIALAIGGVGPLSLAIGRVTGQLVSTILQFVVTRERLRFGWNPTVARTGIAFGLPLAFAGLLSWVLLNVDTIVVGSTAGATALGFYVLAFNISSWPSSVIGSAVRAVAFPAFAQRGSAEGKRDIAGVTQATGLVWAGALPVGIALAVLAEPVIRLLYGERWMPSAAVLAGLGIFGALRVAFDLWVAFLTACGAAAALVWTQLAWIVLLVPAMVVGVHYDGIRGAAWAHAVVAIVLMLPIYLFTMHRNGAATIALLRSMVPATLAAAPTAVVGWLVVGHLDHWWWQLLLGGAAMVGTYLSLLAPWLAAQRRRLQAPADLSPVPSVP